MKIWCSNIALSVWLPAVVVYSDEWYTAFLDDMALPAPCVV